MLPANFDGSSSPEVPPSPPFQPLSVAAATDRLLSSYDYHLPPERIAQNPVVPRDRSRLLVVKDALHHEHRIFRELGEILQPGDLLVMNNTRVIPARLYGQTTTGAQVEILLLEERGPCQWLSLVKPGKRFKVGTTLKFSPLNADGLNQTPPLWAEVVCADEATGGRVLEFSVPNHQPLLSVLEHYGHVPLPPYITASESTSEQYQTIYAERDGSVAAPTAGLHFTPDLFARLEEKGIQRTFLTLHVGVGTFRPVEAEDITTHTMHGEWLEVSPDVVQTIQDTKQRGGRVIAVGTTVTRALEGAAQQNGLQPYCDKTELFIYPGYHWRVVDGLITNFHLPKSSLMMLVSALIGRERLLALYNEAIAQQYRFYSFGDAMLILPEANMQHGTSRSAR